MNYKNEEILDLTDNFWDFPDEKVIWEGFPSFKKWLHQFIIGLVIALGIVPFAILYFFYELELVLVILLNVMYWFSFGFASIYFTYDYFRKRRLERYCLLTNFFIMRAGDKLTTKGFRFSAIQDVYHKKEKHVILKLKNKISNPFTTIPFLPVNKIKLGPINDAEGVAQILKSHILNANPDYNTLARKMRRNSPHQKTIHEEWLEESGNRILLAKPKKWDVRRKIVLSLLILGSLMFLAMSVAENNGYSLSFSPFSIMFFLFMIIAYIRFSHIRKHSWYDIRENALLICAGYNLRTLKFNWDVIKNAFTDGEKIFLVLHDDINHPFYFRRISTDRIKIGPFEDPEIICNFILQKINT